MIEEVIYKLLDTGSFSLRLNEKLPTFTCISELLTHNNISFQTWYPKGDSFIETIEMAFSVNCNFQDVYLLAYLLRDFGLTSIYPSRKVEPEISIGTYLYQVNDMGEYALAEPMNINSFLNLDPKLDSLTIVTSFFENHFNYNEIEED